MTIIPNTYAVYSMALYDDGRILMSGHQTIRLLGDGTIDTTFGGGDGIALGMGASNNIVILDDEKLLLSGTTEINMNEVETFPGSGVYLNADFYAVVVRLNTDGSMDTTFANAGILYESFAAGGAQSHSIHLDASNRIVIVGSQNYDSDFAVARYLSNGTRDTSFGGGNGYVTRAVPPGSSALFQADGKILIGGYQEIFRLEEDGDFDTSFDGDGALATNLTSATNRIPMAIQPDGKIVVGGLTVAFSPTRVFFSLTRIWP